MTMVIGSVSLISHKSCIIASPSRAVEIAGWLIGEENRRPIDQSAGQSRSLLLSAGKLAGPMRQPGPKPNPLDRLSNPGRSVRTIHASQAQ